MSSVHLHSKKILKSNILSANNLHCLFGQLFVFMDSRFAQLTGHQDKGFPQPPCDGSSKGHMQGCGADVKLGIVKYRVASKKKIKCLYRKGHFRKKCNAVLYRKHFM